MNLGSLTLEKGQVLSDVTIAYDTYARTGAGWSQCHSHHPRLYQQSPRSGAMARQIAKVGWWIVSLDPGKRSIRRALCGLLQVLGSCYGRPSRKPQPGDGKALRAQSSPIFTMRDIVVAQREFLNPSGCHPPGGGGRSSLGGRQAFQWAVTYPDFMDGIVAVASSPKGLGKDDAVHHLMHASVDRSQLNDGLVLRAGRDHPHPHRYPHGPSSDTGIEASSVPTTSVWAARSAHSATG